MPYTIEDFRKEMKKRALKLLTPKEVAKAFPAQEIVRAFPAEERLRGLSQEEIEAYLRKIKRKAKPKKKG